MATETTAPAPAPAPAAPPPNGAPTDNASLLAELESLPGAQEAKPPIESDGEPKEPPPPTEDEPSPDADEPEEPDADAEIEEEDTAAPPDRDRDKRLDAIQKAEKRAKGLIAAERAAFEAERQSFEQAWRPKVEAAQRFERLATRAKYDPAGVLMALGLTAEELDPAARQVYSASTAGSADPRIRDAAQREMRERQHGDELAETRRELAELRTQVQTQAREVETQRQVGAWLDTVTKAASDDTPLVRAMLAKAPDKARRRLHEVAVQLSEQEDGEVPEPADVVRALEAARRAELDELGIDFNSLSALPKNKTPGSAGEKKTAKTLGSDLGTPARPRTAPTSRQDEIADVRRALETGRLE